MEAPSLAGSPPVPGRLVHLSTQRKLEDPTPICACTDPIRSTPPPHSSAAAPPASLNATPAALNATPDNPCLLSSAAAEAEAAARVVDMADGEGAAECDVPWYAALAGAGDKAPQLLMHQLQSCKELGENHRSYNRVSALAQYCSRDIPGHADRLLRFDRALNGDPSRLLDILMCPQTISVPLAESEGDEDPFAPCIQFDAEVLRDMMRIMQLCMDALNRWPRSGLDHWMMFIEMANEIASCQAYMELMEASAYHDPADAFQKYLGALTKCLLAPLSTGTSIFELEEYCHYATATITCMLVGMSICSVRGINLAMGAGIVPALEALLVVDAPLPLLRMGVFVLSKLLSRIQGGMDDEMIIDVAPVFGPTLVGKLPDTVVEVGLACLAKDEAGAEAAMLALQCMQHWPSADFFPPSNGDGSGPRWTLLLRRCIECGHKWKDVPLLEWSATALLLPHFNNYERTASGVLDAGTLNALVDAIDMSIGEVLPASLAGPLAEGLEYRCTHSVLSASLVDLLGAPCNSAKLLQFFGPSFYPGTSHTLPDSIEPVFTNGGQDPVPQRCDGAISILSLALLVSSGSRNLRDALVASGTELHCLHIMSLEPQWPRLQRGRMMETVARCNTEHNRLEIKCLGGVPSFIPDICQFFAETADVCPDSGSAEVVRSLEMYLNHIDLRPIMIAADLIKALLLAIEREGLDSTTVGNDGRRNSEIMLKIIMELTRASKDGKAQLQKLDACGRICALVTGRSPHALFYPAPKEGKQLTSGHRIHSPTSCAPIIIFLDSQNTGCTLTASMRQRIASAVFPIFQAAASSANLTFKHIDFMRFAISCLEIIMDAIRLTLKTPDPNLSTTARADIILNLQAAKLTAEGLDPGTEFVASVDRLIKQLITMRFLPEYDAAAAAKALAITEMEMERKAKIAEDMATALIEEEEMGQKASVEALARARDKKAAKKARRKEREDAAATTGPGHSHAAPLQPDAALSVGERAAEKPDGSDSGGAATAVQRGASRGLPDVTVRAVSSADAGQCASASLPRVQPSSPGIQAEAAGEAGSSHTAAGSGQGSPAPPQVLDDSGAEPWQPVVGAKKALRQRATAAVGLVQAASRLGWETQNSEGVGMAVQGLGTGECRREGAVLLFGVSEAAAADTAAAAAKRATADREAALKLLHDGWGPVQPAGAPLHRATQQTPRSQQEQQQNRVEQHQERALAPAQSAVALPGQSGYIQSEQPGLRTGPSVTPSSSDRGRDAGPPQRVLPPPAAAQGIGSGPHGFAQNSPEHAAEGPISERDQGIGSPHPLPGGTNTLHPGSRAAAARAAAMRALSGAPEQHALYLDGRQRQLGGNAGQVQRGNVAAGSLRAPPAVAGPRPQPKLQQQQGIYPQNADSGTFPASLQLSSSLVGLAMPPAGMGASGMDPLLGALGDSGEMDEDDFLSDLLGSLGVAGEARDSTQSSAQIPRLIPAPGGGAVSTTGNALRGDGVTPVPVAQQAHVQQPGAPLIARPMPAQAARATQVPRGRQPQSNATIQNLLQCPITQVRMKDPVIAADGQTYERAAVERWLASLGALQPRSPVTGEILEHSHLLPNLAVRALLGSHSASGQRSND